MEKKKKKLEKSWRKYLKDSKLSPREQKERAKQYSNRKEKVPR
jgi:hypothetical protein